MSCNLDKIQLDALLCKIPTHWRGEIVNVLDKFLQECDEDRPTNCESVSSLSPFNLSGNILSISYTNEYGVPITRSIDVQPLIDSLLDDLDPKCLMDSEDWSLLSHTERLQAIMTAKCECCDPTTTTTSTSTTTTTTECPNVIDIQGESGADGEVTTLYFWGWKADNITLTPSEITASPNFATLVPGSDLLTDFSGGSASPQFLWMAEPSTEPIKNQWQDVINLFNNGNIGSPTDLFDAPVISGGFRFYISVYPTQQSNPILFEV